MRDFIKKLAGSGVHLYLDDGKLKLRSFQPGAEREFLDEIRSNRESLVAYLQDGIASRTLTTDTRARIVERARIGDRVRTSFAQQQLWLIDRLYGGSAHYNIPAALRVTGDFNLDLAEAAFEHIIARHAPLRTIFVTVGDEPWQVIREEARLTIRVHDLRGLSAEQRDQEQCKLAQDDASTAFDLAQDLMLRVSFVRRRDDEGILLFNVHHIAADAWSMDILMREFVVHYEALRERRAVSLVPLTIQYADFAEWQRDWLQGEVVEKGLAYWTRQLADLPPVHSLPLDHRRPAQQRFQGARQSFVLDKAIVVGLKALAQRQRATLFMVLHAALGTLLARHGNSNDIVIATPVANRLQKELEGLIGLFVNTLVLRVDCSGNPRFTELLERVRTVNLDAQSHQDLPFELLVRHLQPVRSIQYSPLFQIMLNMDSGDGATGAAMELDGLEFSPLGSDVVSAKYDLLFNASETEQGLALAIDYDVDLFSAATIARMAEHLGSLLKGLAADPQTRIHALPLLSGEEQHYLLQTLNAAQAVFPQELCIHELFEAQVAKTPNQLAVVFEHQQLTYAELNARANQLAHYLRDAGVKPDTLVGLCVERGLEMLVGLIGILKAGGAYVPLDPAYPRDRLAYMVEDSGVEWLLTQESLRDKVAAPRVLCLDSTELQHCSTSNPGRHADQSPHNLAYVIYTSGSTGQPKGVMIEHHNVTRLFAASARKFDFNAQDVWTLFHSFAFDFSVWEIWGALLHGGRLVVVPQWITLSPADFHALLVKEHVTVLNQTPRAFEQLITVDTDSNASLSLRYVIFGGEALNIARLQPWIDRHGDAAPQLINMYGITETTVHVTYRRLLSADIYSRDNPSVIGHVLSDLSAVVLSPERSLAPIGTAGELYVGGAGLARGYLNRPELTADRFIINPFHDPNDPKSSERLYKTGDLVRYLPDGNLEYLGRIDDQVKIRGFRIELGEIESALRAHPEVREVVVLAREDAPGQKRLVAYVLGQKDSAPPNVEHLRTGLLAQLPEYMVPALFVVLDEFPLTRNGKIDKKALPVPEANLLEREHAAPQTRTEQTLVDLCAQLLQLKPAEISATANFFALGGHSLLVMQFVSSLRQAGLKADIKTIYGAASLRALAATLDDDISAGHRSFVAPANLIPHGCDHIEPGMLPLVSLTEAEVEQIVATVPGGATNVQDIYPLAPLQEGLLFFHLLHRENDPYLIPVLLSVASRVRFDALIGALQRVIDRHDVLRTAVVSKNVSTPVQVVYRRAELRVEMIELDSSQDAVSQMKARFDEPQVMDISRAPMLRIQAAQDPYSPHVYVLFQIHHLVEDVTSTMILEAEVRACLEGRGDELATPVPYREFVAHALYQAKHSDAESFFSRMLEDVTEPTAPFNLMDVHGDGSQIVEARKSLEPAFSNRIRQAARHHQISPAVLFHAAWAMVVAACSGRSDVVFGTVLSGRLQGITGVQHMLGMFINTLPLRVRLEGFSVAQLVEHVGNALRDLLAYEQVPLSTAQKCSGLAVKSSLFSALMNYRHSQNTAAPAVDDAGIRLIHALERANYPFIASIDDMEEAFSIDVQVDRSVDPERVIGYLEATLAAIVGALKEQPDMPVLGLWGLPPSERQSMGRPALPASNAPEAATYVAPRTAMEAKVAGIWSELLGVERVGINDNFFELGGHSLLAMRLLARDLGAKVALSDLFARPTLTSFAEGLQVGATETAPPLVAANRDEPLPLSYMQQRLWFLSQLEGASAAYHMPAALRLQGTLDAAALRRALDRIVERHEVLRTVFVDDKGVAVQVVNEAASFALKTFDVSEMEVEEHAQLEGQESFDLGSGPLIRGRLLRLNDQEHVLFVTMHHIVSDGWSMGVLIRELSELYGAFCERREDPLLPLQLQYADYAVWQRRWLQGEVLQQRVAYWRDHLEGAPALLELPTDRPRPAVQSYAGGNIDFSLGTALSTELKAFAREQGITLFMALYAALTALLSRLSGQSDVVIGTPVANRPRMELEELIGFFVNTLALRLRLDDDPSVAALIEQARAITLDGYEHQDVPFEQVVEAVQPPRSLSRSPIFQILFVFQNTPPSTLQLGELRLQKQELPHFTSQFDLSVSMEETFDDIVGSFEYASDLFDRSTIERWISHFKHLLTGMISNVEARLSELPLLSDAERHHLLYELNVTEAPFPQDKCLHQLFEDQVERAPEQVAVVLEGSSLTYHELNQRANRLAHCLRARGVGPDCLVGICIERSVEMVIGLLGILKAGGAYVPLDPNYPKERLAYMLEDAAPKVLLTQRSLVGALPEASMLLCLDEAGQELSVYSDANPAPLAQPQNLAYVIYTSGSTGQPKGVLVEHRGLVNLLAFLQRAYELEPRDRLLQFSAISFDMSIEEIFGALCSGCTLVLRTADWVGEAAVFWRHCRSSGVSVVNLPTAYWAQLIGNEDAAIPSCIRQVMIGGEEVKYESIARWFEREGPLPRLFNAYGPTEASVDATVRLIDGLSAAARSIGRPIGNTRVYILDQHGKPAPLGIAGELHIGGVGVARGYLNRPALTAERFIVDPYAGDDSRLYKTGDVARYLPDGNIEYLGRNDDQVKIRGFRIELGEIESALRAQPNVREAVVLAREDVPGEKRLVAYVLGRKSVVAPTPEQLRTALAANLPEYMVPVAYVVLDALPLTPNGKVDRKALPAPDSAALISRAYAPPVGEIELALASIWREVLQVQQIGRHDNFFELGGHSLLATQVVARIQRVLGRAIQVRDLFEHPSIRELSAQWEKAHRVTLAAIDRVSRDQLLPLSYMQQRLWFLSQLEGASAAYHMPAALRLRGTLDEAALRRALDRIIERHEVLRTVFVDNKGVAVQVVNEAASFVLKTFDVSEAEVEEHARLEGQESFDLESGPLVRGRLLRLNDQEHVLFVTMHHIVSDGWSMGVLIRELSELYAAFSEVRSDPLPPLQLQYADYAVWQRQWLQGEALQQRVAYWRDHLEDAPALLELPTDRQRPAVQSYAGGEIEFSLGAELSAQLKRLADRHAVTLYMVLHAGFAAFLSRMSGQRDVVIGTSLANRPRVELEELIGFFVNNLALRLRLEDDPSIEALLRQAKAVTLAGYAHQEVPFEQVVEALQPPRSLGHSPIFQVLFAFQNTPSSSLQLGELQLSAERLPHLTSQFDIAVSMEETPEGIAGSFEYASDLFDRSTIERWIDHFKQLLSGMASDASLRISELSLLSEAERHHLLYELNATEAPYPQDKCVHQLFEEQVERTPDAVAVTFASGSFSYRELNRRANQLAHHLRGLGVGPDCLVGLCVERSPEMIVGVLGILKAGGAYVPLDPGYPAQRLAFMLGDSQLPVLLTRAALEEDLPAHLGTTFLLDADWARLERQPTTNPDIRAAGLSAEHLAYVIYTSGSTGTPKGVMVEHKSVLNYLHWAAGAYKLRAGASAPLNTSIAFDATVTSLWGPLSTGGCIELLPEGQQELPQLADLLLDRSPGLVKLTPSHLHVLEQLYADSGRVGHADVFVIGGEALTRRHVAFWRERAPGIRLINEYGPTEATVGMVTHEVDAVDVPGSTIPIGRPIQNTRVYVLDERGEPVPMGVTGEIHIGGVGVARGYWQRPELTAERFISSSFVGGDRLYRTGDRGRYLPDGRLEFLGRDDDQVKIQGYRIELGEIESRLANHAEVREAVVMAREDIPGGKRLVAYYTEVDEEGQTRAEDLRAYLAETLPKYMVPSAYVRLQTLPLTTNGKLDRNRLPAPEGAAYGQGMHEAPRGDVEKTLARIWSEVLGVERIGRNDNFFELGGHSLLAVRVIAQLRDAGFQLDVRTPFETPVLKDLAAAASAERGVVDVPPNVIPEGCTRLTPDMLPLVQLTQEEVDIVAAAVPGGSANVKDVYSLTPLQEGILVHHLMDRAAVDPYTVWSLKSFATRARLDDFVEALRLVLSRHDILRTAVLWEGLSQPVQVVWRAAPLVVEEIDCDPAGENLIEQLCARFKGNDKPGIDVRKAPMLRLFVAHDAARSRWLLIDLVHHLIDDVTSYVLFRSEIEAHLAGRAHELPEPLPFRNFVAQMRRTVRTEAHERFFRQMLGDVQEPTAPFGLLDVLGDGGGIDEARMAVDRGLGARLRSKARALGLSPASLLHVAWGQVIAKASGQVNPVFGTVLLGRMHGGAGAERVGGLYINTLPIRLQMGSIGVEQSVRQTQQLLAELMQHEHAPLALAQRCSSLPARVPLFSALLNYRRSDAQPDDDDQEQLQLWDGIEILEGEERTNYPLALSVDDQGAEFWLTAQVGGDVSAARVCAMMHRAIETLVEALERAPLTPVGSLDVLPKNERQQLLVEWNRTEQEYPRHSCIHHLFEQQVKRDPQATAVVSARQSVSYGELNRRANQLAHALRRLGVAPEVLVGICGERSIEMIVAMLGILKAGGAYVPLDPGHPAERLQFMLSDSAPAVVLSRPQARDVLQTAMSALAKAPLLLDLVWDSPLWAQEPDHDLAADEIGLSPEHLAYVIYTSGSAGTPKGVMVEHRNVVNHNLSMREAFALGPGDRVLQFASYCFDASVEEIYPTLMSGATLVLCHAQVASTEQFAQQLHADGITVLNLPTAYWQVWVASLPQPAELPQSLRLVAVGGEKAMMSSLQRWCERVGPAVQWLNTYGPTETTVSCTLYRATEQVLSQSEIPIGRPIANTKLYVLDEYAEPAPMGTVGELYIAGSGVARGYLNRQELTQQRFMPDPFAGGRMYRSGDLARWRADGTLEYAGRSDAQVKIRGYRIELGEIESTLATYAGIRDVAVTVRGDTPAEKRLIAYYTEVGDAELAHAEALRAYLSERLPKYMVPAAYVRLQSLALTANGKLDRQNLPAPEGDAYGQRVHQPPRGDVEQKLARIWSEVLGVERIGRNDNFFELGGHSLLALRAFERMRREGLQVDLRTLLTAPTLEACAQRVRAEQGLDARSASNPSALVPIREGDLPPLILVHALGGGLGYYSALVDQLPKRQAVYGLHAFASTGDNDPQMSVSSMCQSYAEAVMQTFPTGPYHLAGWSAGGVLAQEIARRLVVASREVRLLALIDTAFHSLRVDPAAADPLELPAELMATLQVEPDAEMTIRRHAQALDQHVPSRYVGSAVCYIAQDEKYQLTASNWEGCLDTVEVVAAPGTHYTILQQPGIAAIAQDLARRISSEQG